MTNELAKVRDIAESIEGRLRLYRTAPQTLQLQSAEMIKQLNELLSVLDAYEARGESEELLEKIDNSISILDNKLSYPDDHVYYEEYSLIMKTLVAAKAAIAAVRGCDE